MSGRRPARPSRLRSLQQHSAIPSSVSRSLLPAESAPLQRRPYAPELIVLADPPLREGSVDYVQPHESLTSSMHISAEFAFDSPEDDEMDMNPGSFNDIINTIKDGDGGDTISVRANKNYVKKARQWKKWRENVIPSLLYPYLKILRQTHSLRDPIPVTTMICPNSCGMRRAVDVVCVSFDSESTIPSCLLHLLPHYTLWGTCQSGFAHTHLPVLTIIDNRNNRA